MLGFTQVPAVVSPLGDQIDFFPEVLAHISGPELPVRPIEGHAPDVTDAVGVDFRTSNQLLIRKTTDEWIVFRDRVFQLAVFVIHIDSQDFTQQSLQVLSVAMWIVSCTAITDGNVQISVWTKANGSPLMVPIRMVDRHQDFFTRGIRLVGILFRNLESRDHGRMGFFLSRIIHEELAVGLEFGMECHPE